MSTDMDVNITIDIIINMDIDMADDNPCLNGPVFKPTNYLNSVHF
jgi:hypothetical protein